MTTEVKPAPIARRSRRVIVALATITLGLASVSTARAAVTLQDILVEPATASLVPGQAIAYRAIGKYSDGSTQNITSRVVFVSRNSEVVAVSAAGAGQAVASGRTEVSATDPTTGRSSRTKAQVTVAAMTALTVSPTAMRLVPGSTGNVRAIASFDNGVEGVDVSALVNWASDKRTVASVVKNGDGTVTVSALRLGNTRLIAKDPDTGLQSDKTTGLLAVTQTVVPRLTGITIVPDTLQVVAGDKATVQAVGSYDDGSSSDVSAKVTWTSTRTSVATVAPVSGGAEVTGAAPGDARIVATEPESGVASSATTGLVTVTRRPKLLSFRIILESPAVRVGGRTGVSALGTFDDGRSDVDISDAVDWTSTDPRVGDLAASPDGGVDVVGISPGSFKIKARNRETGIKAESPQKVAVVSTLASVAVSPAKKTIRLGARNRLAAVGTFERGVTVDLSRDVQWSSSATDVASVDVQGRVTGLKPGRTTISAVDTVTGLTSTASGGDSTVTIVGDLLSMQVTPAVLALGLGEVGALRAGGTFADEPSSVNLTGKVEWVLSDPTVASITPAGGVACLAQGSTWVSAVDPATGISSNASGGDAQVLCAIPITGIAVFPATLQLKLDKTKKSKAFLTYANGTQIDITKRVQWDSTNKLVATVDGTEPNIGRVKPQTPGQATIFVTDPVTKLGSTSPGGTSLAVTVVGP